jgi:hypothetical protein
MLDSGKMIYHWPGPPPRNGGPRNNFDENMLTWPSPWTFETPPGWDLLILPPPNVYLPDGVTVLTALVETDHIPASFTFNWRVTPGTSVWVNPGDIVCRLLPYPTAVLEEFQIEQVRSRQPGYDKWLEERSTALQAAATPEGKWGKLYWDEAKRRKIKRAGDNGQAGL